MHILATGRPKRHAGILRVCVALVQTVLGGTPITAADRSTQDTGQQSLVAATHKHSVRFVRTVGPPSMLLGCPRQSPLMQLVIQGIQRSHVLAISLSHLIARDRAEPGLQPSRRGGGSNVLGDTGHSRKVAVQLPQAA